MTDSLNTDSEISISRGTRDATNRSLVPATNTIIQEFADLLAVIATAAADNKITKQEAAIKQLANKAASGDKRAIQDMIRFQTMLFLDAPMRSGEPPIS